MVNHDPLRNQKWRLGVLRHCEEVTHNVSKTCRHFGISRNAFYMWQRRYKVYGAGGLIDCSHRPIHSPRATKPEVLAKIIYLRQTYHFGAWKIMVYLERYHDIHVNSSGIWRILNKLHMNRLPSNQRYKRHLCAIPAALQDGGGPDRQRPRVSRAIPLACARQGVNHVYIEPRRPRLIRKVERSHRVDEEEFYRMLRGVVIDDTELFNEKLKEWDDFYNYQRPHSALAGMTPYERFRERAGLLV